MDKHYWKEAYKDAWGISSEKEANIKRLIEAQTNSEVIEIGLGAGSSEFISGSASDNELTKGDADLYVKESDCYVEVTGPNIKMSRTKPLWIRPDKIRNSLTKLESGQGKLHVVVHVLEEYGQSNPIIRVVNLDAEFARRFRNNEFETVNPRIRGKVETYTEILYDDQCIMTFEDFVELIS